MCVCEHVRPSAVFACAVVTGREMKCEMKSPGLS